MAGDITLPVVGSTSRRALLIGGVGAVAVMGLLWWRKRQTAAATPTVGADTTGDSGVYDPNAPVDSTDLSGGAYTGTTGISGGVTSTPATDAQWTAQVMTALLGIVDPTALSAALGKYITGQAVTGDEESLIDQAIAVGGYPPVGGPGGYPPAIRTQAAGGQTPPGGGVTGGGDTGGLLTPTAPRASSITSTSVQLTTSAIPGATLYEWSDGHANHAHTSGPSYTWTHLAPKSTHRFSVQSVGPKSQPGAFSPETVVTTK